ncbi:protein translocase subunit SecD [bacterium]|nr:protein translocase subunit SecD [bacterium]
MRNKGFFWFLTILTAAICLYQLSFTWVANNTEDDAEKQATLLVAKKKKEAMSNNNGIATIGVNNDTIDFNNPGSEEIAKGIITNQILKSQAEKPVYPILGYTFSEVKKYSLAFGLDLVGGMSVTLEIDVPKFVKTLARRPNLREFYEPFDKAVEKYNTKDGQDFIELFAAEYLSNPENETLSSLFDLGDLDNDKIKKTLKDKVVKSMKGLDMIMSERINQFGVAQPNIQMDEANNRIFVELPGVQDDKTVAAKLQSTANLEFFEIYAFDEIVNDWGKADELFKPDNEDSVDIVKSLKSLVTQMSNGNVGYVLTDNDRAAVDKILSIPEIREVFDKDLKFMWSSKKESYTKDTKKKAWILYACKIPQNPAERLDGKYIESADDGYDQAQGEIIVTLKFTEDGTDKWGELTKKTANKNTPNSARGFIAVTMDDRVFSAPFNKEAIYGNTQISGDFTFDEAKNLADLLNGGSLPAPLVVKELTKVGPTIGKENTRAGLISFGIAFLLVFLYMYFYYGRAGIVADIALTANVLFIFGVLAAFGAVLTLAGIAGIVLTIGMAVDANVLIFERIREEQAKGKDLSGAVKTGFQKALSSIIDANVTTLLTAIVLFYLGAGPIKSFATTLIIGIFSSVFAALIISRLIIERWLSKGVNIEFGTKLTKNAFKNIKINFLDKRKMMYVLSLVLVGGSLILLLTKGLSQSVEFTGGRIYTVQFEKSAANQTEFIKSELSKSFKGSSVEVKTKSNSYNVEINTNYLLQKRDAEEEVRATLNQGLANCSSKLGKYTIEPDMRFVSSTVSKELKDSSVYAISLSLLIIFIYIFVRFGKWQFSMSAIIALFHDVIIVLGIFAMLDGVLPFNMDIDQAFVAAILTVIGYSINDTVVVFDRIREDLSWKKESDFKSEINGALNATLSRTINTSMTTFVVLLIIFVFGGAAIKGFIFALIIGILVGTYSSMFVATPLLVDLTKKIKLGKS